MTSSVEGGTGARPVRRPRTDPYNLEDLLSVVVEVFNERGYDATSMEDVARATGRTKSSIYHHVSGKEDLLRLAVSRAVDALFRVLDEPASRSGAAVDRLEHVVRGSARVLVAELPYVTLLLRVRGNTGTERWALERRRAFDRRVGALVQQAMDEGSLRSDLNPQVVSKLLFGMVNSLTEWVRPGAQGSAAVEQAIVSLSFDGLRAPGGQAAL